LIETDSPRLDRDTKASLRERVHTVIFESDTRGGRLFDVILIWAILLSVAAVMLESVEAIRNAASGLLYTLEWFFTIAFTIEYAARLWCSPRRVRYARSFFGIVDVLAFLPTWLALFFPVLHAFGVIRVFRLLRLFRVFKLLRYMHEASVLAQALRNAQPKITVFLITLGGIVVSLGSLMYLVESADSGFTSIPKSIYWAIITVTTVGYGDVVPVTVVGQTIASIAMILGYAVIAVPTGIISAEWANIARNQESLRACATCDTQGHARDASFCRGCGAALPTV
jgi:voltage-gated potassium channel